MTDFADRRIKLFRNGTKRLSHTAALRIASIVLTDLVGDVHVHSCEAIKLILKRRHVWSMRNVSARRHCLLY